MNDLFLDTLNRKIEGDFLTFFDLPLLRLDIRLGLGLWLGQGLGLGILGFEILKTTYILVLCVATGHRQVSWATVSPTIDSMRAF